MSHNAFKDLKFNGTWRPYQARVLKALYKHLDDERLHLVAAPGAGKTTLGLEVFCRLQRKALVLSPTRLIRDQWLSRFDDFSPKDNQHLKSSDLKNSALLSSVTYQALHYLAKNSSESDKALNKDEEKLFQKYLEDENFELLILDEAHHLTGSWWKVLNEIVKKNKNLKLVVLTATPPYDVQGAHWKRYQELCGPVDEEISIPELVKEENLAPHQDFIWPIPFQDHGALAKFEQSKTDIFTWAFQHSEFWETCLAHPWLDPASVIDSSAIFDKPELALALLSFQRFHAHRAAPKLLETLGLLDIQVPEMNESHKACLIESFLFYPDFPKVGSTLSEDFTAELLAKLKRAGLCKRKKLSLEMPESLLKKVNSDPELIQACLHIHNLESQRRGRELYQVILTDFIHEDDEQKLGAWAIFHRLVSLNPDETTTRMALISGRLSLCHKSLLYQYSLEELTHSDFPELPGFVKLTDDLSKINRFLTQALSESSLELLVGTKALLGEGWDCPPVNSLILATPVASFVQSNQMRGRAIRRDHQKKDKVASIWHIQSIIAEHSAGSQQINKLQRRFSSFAALDNQGQKILSGLQRIWPEHSKTQSTKDLLSLRQEQIEAFEKIDQIQDQWQKALHCNTHSLSNPGLEIQHFPQINPVELPTYQKLERQVSLAQRLCLSYAVFIFIPSFFILLPSVALSLHTIAVCLSSLLTEQLRTNYKAYKKLSLTENCYSAMANILIESLYQESLIQNEAEKFTIEFKQDAQQKVSLSLKGEDYYDKSLILEQFQDLISDIDNPRYIIHIPQSSGKKFYAVPTTLASHKEKAQNFFKRWSEHFPDSKLIYTRNKTGRSTLLKAQTETLCTEESTQIQHFEYWG